MIYLSIIAIIVIIILVRLFKKPLPSRSSRPLSSRSLAKNEPIEKRKKVFTEHEFEPPRKPLADGRLQPPKSAPYFIGIYGPLAKQRGMVAEFSLSTNDIVVIPSAEHIKKTVAYAFAQIEYIKEGHEFMLEHENTVSSARAVMADVKMHYIDCANIYMCAIAEADRWRDIPKSVHYPLWKPAKPNFDAVMAAADAHPEGLIREYAWVLHYAKKVWDSAQADATNIKAICRDNKRKQAKMIGISQIDLVAAMQKLPKTVRSSQTRESDAEQRFMNGDVNADLLK